MDIDLLQVKIFIDLFKSACPMGSDRFNFSIATQNLVGYLRSCPHLPLMKVKLLDWFSYNIRKLILNTSLSRKNYKVIKTIWELEEANLKASLRNRQIALTVDQKGLVLSSFCQSGSASPSQPQPRQTKIWRRSSFRELETVLVNIKVCS